MKLILPANNLPERKYIVEVLLNEWLGLEYKIEIATLNTNYVVIELSNGNSLQFEDHFFNHFPATNEWLKADNVPKSVTWAAKSENPFLIDSDLPIIFGNNRLDSSPSQIICGIDIFAASFFMLTRWEEYVLKDRDQHDRFPANASLAVKMGFIQRPIVNEMLEMLWNMLVHLGLNQKRKLRQFEVILTHDVDNAILWRSFGFFLKKFSGDLFKRFNLKELEFDLNNYYNTRFKNQKDPYDTFDYLMNLSDEHHLTSNFFFLCGGDTKFDFPLEIKHPFMSKLFRKIEDKGHLIGLHPSYNALDDSILFIKEKEALENVARQQIQNGRQHFLRFEVPATWQLWEDQGMTWDSSLYYPEKPGFRCGVCYQFSVFNFLTRQKLQLKELPLTAMEVSWTSYLNVSPSKMLEDILKLKYEVSKYNGSFVLLWHNSSFNTPQWKAYTPVYEIILAKNKVN